MQPRTVVACATTLFALANHAGAAGTASNSTKTLGTVTVTGARPTSLPTQIPTTIEGITGAQVERQINATDSEDALKYFPSLLVRKRYVGDFDHAVLGSRASGTNNSARSLVYADGILLSNLLGNGATFTPRWGMVTPEEIERVDVLYGPFSAAYPGNSVGAVVDYVTRMPTKLEGHAKIAGFGENFATYGSDDRYGGWQASASIGDKIGRWSGWLNFNRLHSDGHPLAFANKLIDSGAQVTSGVPVTGALRERNPRNQPWQILGATNQIDTVQDHAKAKLAYDVSATLRASYTLGWWRNEAVRNSQTYLRDANGNPVYNGNVSIDGRQYSISATDFAISRNSLVHLMHGLSLKTDTRGAWDGEIAASLYDYSRDLSRSPTEPLPAAAFGGAGRISDQHGTGWNTLSLRGVWRPTGIEGAHQVDLGYQRDQYKLRTRVEETNDWMRGAAAGRVSGFNGNTRLQSLYAQDTWRIAPAWQTTLGLRAEAWKASEGSISNATTTKLFPTRTDSYYSPKAALAYQLNPAWTLNVSLGRAFRLPTVAELYQGSIATDVIVNNDPDLRPEKSWTSEATAQREFDDGLLRTTLFFEDTRDALYSQTNVTVVPNVTSIQNVDHIRTAGLEIASQFSHVLVPGLSLSASATYTRSRIEANHNFPASVGKWQPRVPEWRANLLASYALAQAWHFTFGVRYSGTQYNTLDNGDTNGFAYTGTSSFLVADVRVRYRISDQLSASLGVDNIGNQHYWAFHPYTQRSVAAEIGLDF